MKKIFVLFLSLILLSFAVLPCAAASKKYEISGIEFSIDESYSVNTDKDLSPSSTVSGLIFVAISKDSHHQIQCRQTETEFSREMGSFQDLNSETLKPAGQKLFPEGYDTVSLGGTLYLKSATIKDGEASVVYVTVTEGKLYTFSYFGTDASAIGEFMNSVKLPKAHKSSGLKIVMIILIAIFLLADVVFAVLLIMSFVRDYRRKKMEMEQNIVSQYIKIKRRKY